MRPLIQMQSLDKRKKIQRKNKALINEQMLKIQSKLKRHTYKMQRSTIRTRVHVKKPCFPFQSN